MPGFKIIFSKVRDLPSFILKGTKQAFLQHKHFAFLIAGFLIAEVLVNPSGSFPLNDDWAYAHAVIKFNNHGEINFGNFPAMTLFSHIVWGSLFTFFTGFTFFALRFSTIVSCIIGLIFLYRFTLQISKNKLFSTFVCLVLLLNPLFFNLANTFMTDINFNTLFIICLYLMYHFFLTGHIRYYIGFVIASIAITLLRQYGIVLPLGFFIGSFFIKEKRYRALLLSIVTVIVTLLVLKYYESYLKLHLPKETAYKFSGAVPVFEPGFWIKIWNSFMLKYKEMAQHILVYSGAFALVFLKDSIKQKSVLYNLSALAACTLVSVLIFTGEKQSSANVFMNMMLGPETFYESFMGARHNYYPGFDTLMLVVKIILSSVTLFVVVLNLPTVISKLTTSGQTRIIILLFVALMLMYSFMILITESYFDRYHLPLITLSLILFTFLFKTSQADFRFAILPLIFWAWVCLAGTKDYFEWNRQRWKAYKYLRNELKIPNQKITGGFEVNCWNDGWGGGWRDFVLIENFDYLIQFNPAKGFVALKEYEFQRYFPFKKDKIYIFVRDSLR